MYAIPMYIKKNVLNFKNEWMILTEPSTPLH